MGSDVYLKDKEYMANQVVIVNENKINRTEDPDKELLLTLTEETIHTMQDYIGTIPKGGTQRDAKHEADILPALKQVEIEYNSSRNEKSTEK
jgi:hypothetical protein